MPTKRAGKRKATEDTLDNLCKHCGKTFSAFLHQMEEHNAKVTCPSCGKPHGVDHPGKTVGKPRAKG
ncbi:MAG: hypothetical protein ABSD39_11440 [Terriglobales bacterium]|jgi:DNA-directed RNA polymerase subunit RPC12/RpoP